MTSTVAARVLRLLFALSIALATLLGQANSDPKIDGFHFKGTSLGGKLLDQDALRKHVVIVDLWGTWCGPCRQAVPVLVDLYQRYKHQGLEIVGFGFAADGSAEDPAEVRRFAADHKITYDLLPGDAAVRDQVPGFKGYPTLLLFARDLVHADTHVGFGDDMASKLDAWVRQALQLDGSTTGAALPAPEPREEVPEGRLFEPGNGDRGFELEAESVDGGRISMAAMRGGPVLLAVTTSWDQEAARTARFLQSLHTGQPTARIVGWHVEGDPDQGRRTAAVRTFLNNNRATYAALATGMKDVRAKVHKFASLPTLLVFDREGVLVARESGISDEIEQRVRAKLQDLSGTK